MSRFYLRPKTRNAADPPRPQVRSDARIYAVGDIHGRHDLLMAMLEKILNDAESAVDDRRCEIIFLGDYIDRGDNTRAVLETLIELHGKTDRGFRMLKGNHEDAMLTFIDAPLKGAAWLDYGAQQTLASYGIPFSRQTRNDADLVRIRDQLVDALGDHIEFLRNLPTHYVSGDVIFTHAGLHPDDAETLTQDKSMLWGHPSSFEDRPVDGKLLIHGHYDAPVAVDKNGRICVDTGAYYSGQLTAVRLDHQVQFLSVNA